EGITETEIAKKTGKDVVITRHILRALSGAQMATCGNLPTYGADRRWRLLPKGEEYLMERNLL
ncbi:MAG TPA: hypothetical protein VNX27_12985, partial [Chthoniobacterales bacterium]|nr:hypothetical protein [Chthoniobacterales bacterium]